MFWSDVVDLLRALIFGVAHVCNGSVGVAVILVSLTIRLALLPLTLRLARRAREHSRKLRELKPELERLQKRYAKDPAVLWRETSRLYQRRGIKPFDSAGMIGGLAQAPIFAALYSTLRRGLGAGIRFLSIGDTSLPNLLLNLTVAGLTAGAVVTCQSPETSRGIQLFTGALIGCMTVWFLGSTSALFALSTGAGSVVTLLQGFILRREEAAVRQEAGT
jgi:YidC/Oxa1 family membrane protein insertase